MEWYDYIFLGALSPFIIVLIGGAAASIIYAYNIAVLLIKMARGKL